MSASGSAPFPVDLLKPQRIHIVGIAGAGMSALASVLTTMGHQVSGSDLKGSASSESLRAVGVQTFVGHDAANLGHPTLVTSSRAVPATNPEIAAALEANIPIVNRTDLLVAIAGTKKTLAVAGTHGKTTTTSMLSLILVEAGFDPCFIVGGAVNELGTGAGWSDSDWLVVEADESDGTFLELARVGGIVTNVEPDHLDHYGGWENYQAAFVQFIKETDGPVLVCSDDRSAAELARGTNAIMYGLAEGSDYLIYDHQRIDRSTQAFKITNPSGTEFEITLPVGGMHNVRNATAAFALALEVGVAPDAAISALKHFAGVHRRFTYRGEPRGITLVDDYAHLPTEVSATLSVALDGGWDRVVAVFQPHRYSRIAALAEGFADSFEGVDVLVITDVYHAHETPIPGVTGRLVVDAVAAKHADQRIVYTPTKEELLEFLESELQEGDLCITLGCGDITGLHDQLEPLLRG